MYKIIIFLVCLFFLIGCGSKRIQNIAYKETIELTQCHDDYDLAPIEFEMLLKEFHIGSEVNQDIIQKNVLTLRSKYYNLLRISFML